MIAVRRPLSAAKDSGVQPRWEVPPHWEVRRIKTLFREKDERRRDGSGLLLSLTKAHGLVPQMEASHRPASSEDLSKYKLCRPGDMVMNRMQAWSGMLAVSSREGLVSPDYSVFAAIGPLECRFFEYLFKTRVVVDEFAKASKGIGNGFNRLYTPEFGAIPVAVPPLAEQVAIVRFLDHADRRIQRCIRAKRKLIELLEEQKQAIIHRAVTRGLDPNVRVKPSGVDWLGDVPEHWDVRRLKTLCWMKSGESIAATSIEATGKYAVYGGNGIRGYTSKYTNDGNYVLVGRQGALCGNVHEARGRFWASEHAVVVKPRVGHDWLWLASLLRAMKLNQYSIAAAQPGLAVERILNLAVPAPPKEEQVRIAAHLESATAGLATSIACYRRGIDLLREFRTRLISDVVTGKLDVRDAAAALPEGGDEVEPADEVESESEDSEVDAEEAEQAPEETDA